MNEKNKEMLEKRFKEILRIKLRYEGDKIWQAIEILTHKLGEKELAFQLRVVYDTHYRPEWKNVQ